MRREFLRKNVPPKTMWGRVNGYRPNDYASKPRETGLADVAAEPQFVPARSNGIAPSDFVFDSSLVLYLPLYKLLGNTFKSQDAYSHACTATGALWTPQGRSFDATDDYLLCGAVNAIKPTSATLIVWVKPSSVAGGNAFIAGLPYANAAWNDPWCSFQIGRTGSNEKIFWNRAGAYDDLTSTDGALTTSSFFCLGATWDGTTANLYRNGALSATETPASGGNITYSAASTFTVGERKTADGAEDYGGVVGEVWLFNRAFAAPEMLHVCAATKWRYQ